MHEPHDPEMKAILTRATNAIIEMNHGATQLVEAVEELEKRVGVSHMPTDNASVGATWPWVALIAAGVGSVVTCAWLTIVWAGL
jgi:hypothetical protein